MVEHAVEHARRQTHGRTCWQKNAKAMLLAEDLELEWRSAQPRF